MRSILCNLKLILCRVLKQEMLIQDFKTSDEDTKWEIESYVRG